VQLIYFAQVERTIADADGPVVPRGAMLRIGGPYFDGPIKIGITGSVYDRMIGLSSATKQRVWLLGSFVGTAADERAMHRMFGHLRIVRFGGSGTEWFRTAWELTNFITSLPDLDVQSVLGYWPRGNPAERNRVRPNRSAGSQQFLRAAYGNSRRHSDSKKACALTAIRLTAKSGTLVSIQGIWSLAQGTVKPDTRLRAVIAVEFGIPECAWDQRITFSDERIPDAALRTGS